MLNEEGTIKSNVHQEDADLKKLQTALSLKQAVFLLGAPDPEMREIEIQALRQGVLVGRCYEASGNRVNARSAYEATQAGLVDPTAPWRHDLPMAVWPQEWTAGVFVECNYVGFVNSTRVDHHNPGDPGWGKGPEEYWAASSIGQACRILEVEADDRLLLIAAADHCLTAAYQGQCLGVDPGELLWSRASWKGGRLGLSVSEAAEAIMKSAADCKAAWSDHDEACVFDEPVKELPVLLAEGAAVAGLPILYAQILETGEVKRMAKGFSPKRIQQIMAEWAQKGVKVYGNPARGYAGCYASR